MHVERSRFALVVHSPDVAEQTLARERNARFRRERAEQIKLLERKSQFLAVVSDRVSIAVDIKARNFSDRAGNSAERGFYPRAQFEYRERLDDIVVRPLFSPFTRLSSSPFALTITTGSRSSFSRILTRIE